MKRKTKQTKARVRGYKCSLPDLPDMKNRSVGVGRYEDGAWYIYGKHDGKKKGLRFTNEAMEHITNMICKVLLNPIPKEKWNK